MKRIVISAVSIIFVVGAVWAVMFYLPATPVPIWIGTWRAGWNNLRGAPAKTIVSFSCRPTGCSGEICADEDVITTCEYKESFACYKKAKCERHKDGKCAWTLTQELLQCLGGRL